ncbi:MAG: nitroreductase family protein [Clostridia bacterium]|nr:nitroreductase family protein [Clostridia bacterium]
MEFFDLIEARYSCKKYADKQVSKEELEMIFEAGRLAPTAKNSQEQRIYVVQSEEGLEKIDSLTPCRYGAKTVLIFACDVNGEYIYEGTNQTSGNEDISIVATHVMLAAKNIGVESCWINKFNPIKCAEIFDLPKNERVVLLMDLGYADKEGGKPLINHFKRKDITEYVIYK